MTSQEKKKYIFARQGQISLGRLRFLTTNSMLKVHLVIHKLQYLCLESGIATINGNLMLL